MSFLKRALVLAEQRKRERGARAEAPEQRALADTGRLGDLIHRYAPRAALREQALGGAQDTCAVTRGVSTLDRARLDQRQFEPCCVLIAIWRRSKCLAHVHKDTKWTAVRFCASLFA